MQKRKKKEIKDSLRLVKKLNDDPSTENYLQVKGL